MKTTLRLLLLLAGTVMAGITSADDEEIYGSAPPPDSAFLRVFNGTARQEIDAHIADKTLEDIGAYQASDYVFLPPGQYTLTVGAASHPVDLKTTLYYTVVFDGKGFRVIETSRYQNKLKAQLVLYNFVDGSTFSLRTHDGRTVVDKVGTNAMGTREVNAVKATLDLYDGNRQVTSVKTMIFERGHSFDLFVVGQRDQPVTSWVLN